MPELLPNQVSANYLGKNKQLGAQKKEWASKGSVSSDLQRNLVMPQAGGKMDQPWGGRLSETVSEKAVRLSGPWGGRLHETVSGNGQLDWVPTLELGSSPTMTSLVAGSWTPRWPN